MESDTTLRQGLEKFRATYKDHLSHDKEDASNEAKAFFESHDVAHVVFGCDISIYGEGTVKIWTIFGTTLGFWKHLKGYQDAHAFELFQKFTMLHIVKNIGKLLLAIPRIIINAKQMSKPWGWGGFEAYLDTPISKIREEFNIKILSLLLIHLVLFSCGKTTQEPTDQSTTIVKQTETTFQTILDSTQVKGAILIYDPQRKVYHSNSFIKAEETYVPASTFKITNSIIGLEMGILQDESTVFEWDGAPRDFPAWEQDLSLREAFQASCVPCYQGLARKIGADSMNAYVQKLDYGKMDIDTNTIDNFWLRGKSRISPMEQVGFLGRLYEGRLPIKNKTMKTLETIMEMESTEEYTLYAKTGLAIDGSKMVGWFVGYQETNDGVYYFVTKLEPTSEEMDRADFLPLRRRVTLAALEHLIQ